MTIQQIEAHANKLAAQILSGEILNGFLALDLEGKLTGICFFAKVGGDDRVLAEAWNALQWVKANA